MPKRQPVDTDYAVFSPFLKDVGTEMGIYSTTSKDVAMVKQAEQFHRARVCHRDSFEIGTSVSVEGRSGQVKATCYDLK
jgi:hypothetical protein